LGTPTKRDCNMSLIRFTRLQLCYPMISNASDGHNAEELIGRFPIISEDM
jgi:hypothetical protein